MVLKERTSTSFKTWLLQLVDHATRYSALVATKSKKKEIILEQLFNVSIKNFGHPEKFLVDNDEELNNDKFKDFCENLNIRILTTAVESLGSNGLLQKQSLSKR